MMDPKYFPPPDRPLSSAPAILGSAYLISTTSVLLPSSFPFRAYLPIPPILYLCYHAQTHRLGSLAEDYLVAIDLVWLLVRWCDVALFHDPDHDLRRVKVVETGEVESLDDIKNLSRWQRLTRTLHLMTNCRGVGWNWQVKNIDPVTETSRGEYLRNRILDIVRTYLLSDLTANLLRNFSVRYESTSQPQSFVQQAVLAWLTAFRGGYDLALAYHIAAFLTVATGLDSPKSYPPLNGRFSSCHTIRKVWGYGWHQYLRRPIEGTGNYLARLFGLRKGSMLSRYFRLYWGFGFSATLHFVGTLNVPYFDGGWANWVFFCGQAVGITVEDMAMELGRRCGIRESRFAKLIGFAWVVSWFSVMLTIGTAQNLVLGQQDIRNPLIVFSLADYLLGKS